MSLYRRLVLFLLSVAAAVVLVARCSSNESPIRSNESLSQDTICNDNETEHRQSQDLCDNNEAEECDDGNSEEQRCVSFCRDIQPVFNNRCTRCHNPDLLRGSLDLTAGNSYANLVNRPTSATCMAQVPNSVRVVPCRPASSMLWLKTRPDDSRCGRPMPFGTDGLGVIAPGDFALIQHWIAQGARNN